MAPTRQRKHGKSTESQSSVDVMDFPAPPQTIPTKVSTPTRTPTRRSPMKKAPRGFTAIQKQALLDNLQLEITERARKLRAQYMLQAQGLRTRIEIRVNRIPTALRKAKMGDLLLKYNEAKANSGNAILPGMTARGANVVSPRNLLQENQRNARHSPSPMRQMKRHSDEMIDKENEDLSNPKKRAKAAPQPRVASRTKQADQVLSPRSANPRNAPVPRSPIRPPTSMAVRPTSPIKLVHPSGAATNMAERAKSSRAATGASKAGTSAVGRPKKAAAAAAPAPRARRGRASNSSESSDTSVKTTIVTRAPPAKKEPLKRSVMGTLKSMGTKKASAAPKPAGRVLRNRGA